jgi:hypothetical protein
MKSARWVFTRNVLLFIGGMAGVYNELVIRHGAERPTTLILLAWMLGAPFVLPGSKEK